MAGGASKKKGGRKPGLPYRGTESGRNKSHGQRWERGKKTGSTREASKTLT